MALNAEQATGKTLFELAFQVSPIILSGGIASYIPGGYLPIIAITEGISVAQGVLNGQLPSSLSDFFAQFTPLPGSTMVRYSTGKYPFANQSVAGNAIIKEPKNVSLRMICPAAGSGGYLAKLATMTMIQTVIEAHCAAGGTFIVMTPSLIYPNCLLLAIEDITGSGTQVQTEWLWNFEQPLVSLSSAQAAMNSLTQMLSNSSQVTAATWGGLGNSVGSPLSGASSIEGVSSVTTGLSQSFVPATVAPVFSQPLSGL